MTGPTLTSRPGAGFHHEALFYRGGHEFVTAAATFVRAALADDEPALVATSAAQIDGLRAELGPAATAVEFVDLHQAGANPARIIPLWREFLDAHPGRSVRGIGEPIWPERTADQMAECAGHELLLNAAFTGTDFWLLCPYDVAGLDPDALATARRTHPFLIAGARLPSPEFVTDPAVTLTGPLPEPARVLLRLPFDRSLAAVRDAVTEHGAGYGLGRDRLDDLVLAVSELAANSLSHGGGGGLLRIWHAEGALVCEVADRGRITQPLVGRHHPSPGDLGGRGLWMVNHLCDLVQVRSTAAGTVVRVHMMAVPSGLDGVPRGEALAARLR